MGLEEVAEELYGLAPGAFVAARTIREKEARSAGDRELAAGIRALGKPSTAAWLVNQLVRQRPEAVLPLLDLGAGLRAAAAALDGPQLRELDRRQYQLVNALVRIARSIGAAAGQPVSPDTARAVEDTVRAALADDEVAGSVRAGRLTGARHPGGFPLPAGLAPTSPTPRSTPAAESARGTAARAPTSLDARREARQRAAAAERERAARLHTAEQDEAEQDEDRARQAVEAAEDALTRERGRADQAEQDRLEGAAAVDRLRCDLEAALSRQSTAELVRTAAQSAVVDAERAGGDARQRLTGARDRVQALRRSPGPG